MKKSLFRRFLESFLSISIVFVIMLFVLNFMVDVMSMIPNRLAKYFITFPPSLFLHNVVNKYIVVEDLKFIRILSSYLILIFRKI